MSVRLAGIDHLSPSGASTLMECERRYWWRYKHGLGKDERTEALAMGGGLAAALEFGDLERGLADYRERRPVIDGWTDPVADLRNACVAEATIRAAYAGYLERWPDDGVIREQTYLVDLETGTPRVLQARVDGCKPGEYLIEDKLRSASSMRADALENEVRQGRQLTAEIFAHWRCTGELLPVRFRVTKKCDPRKVKKCETREQVDEVIGEHFAGDGVFNEFNVERTETQLVDFHMTFWRLLERADATLAAENPSDVVGNEKSCLLYGRVCPALAACQGLKDWHELVDAVE